MLSDMSTGEGNPRPRPASACVTMSSQSEPVNGITTVNSPLSTKPIVTTAFSPMRSAKYLPPIQEATAVGNVDQNVSMPISSFDAPSDCANTGVKPNTVAKVSTWNKIDKQETVSS